MNLYVTAACPGISRGGGGAEKNDYMPFYPKNICVLCPKFPSNDFFGFFIILGGRATRSYANKVLVLVTI